MHRWEALLKEAFLLGDWNSWRTKAAVNKQAQVTNGANNLLWVFIWPWICGCWEDMLEKNCNLSGDRWRRLFSSVRLSSLALPQMHKQKHTHCLRQNRNENTNWLHNVSYITELYSRDMLSLEWIQYDLLMNSKCIDWAADVAEEGQHTPKNY